jgi:hypothetical protein
MTSNFRRSASRRAKESRTDASVNQGFIQRSIIARKYPSLKTLLWQYQTEDGKDCSDTYLVFYGVPSQNALKLAKETATAPIFVVTEIKELSGNSTMAQIPVHPISKVTSESLGVEEFYGEHWPKFESFIFSKTFNIVQIEKTFDMSNGSSATTALDKIKVYFGAIQGTLTDFLSTGNVKSAKMVTLLVRSMNNYIGLEMSSMGSPQTEKFLEALDSLPDLIRGRDGSVKSAKLYEDFIGKLHPSEFYAAQYNLSVTNPELFERSVSSSGEFLYGLLTQKFFGENGVVSEGIEEIFLRMTWERAIKHAGAIKHANIYKMEDLVKKVHEQAGDKIEGFLRMWAFHFECVRSVLTSTGITVEKSINLMVEIRDLVKSLDGLNSISLMIAPQTENHITDAGIAEIIVSAAALKAGKNHLILPMEPLVSKTTNPTLEKIIKFNIDEAKKVQMEMEKFKEPEPVEVSYSDDDEAGPSTLNVTDYWKEFLEIEPIYRADTLKLSIIGYTKAGNLEALKQFYECSQSNYSYGGPKKVRALIIRSSINAGKNDILKHFGYYPSEGGIDHFTDQVPTTSKTSRLLIRAFVDGSSLQSIVKPSKPSKVTSEGKYNPEVNPITYVPMDKAIIRQGSIKKEIKRLVAISKEEMECFICMEEYETQEMTTIHTHSDLICVGCVRKLTLCPLCRDPI